MLTEGGRLRRAMIRRGFLVIALCAAAFHMMRGKLARIGGDRARLPVILLSIAWPAALKTPVLPAFLLRLPPGPRRKPFIVPALAHIRAHSR
jgi:hypothetical protein